MKHRLAICAIIKDERSYLAEWIAYHRLMGATLFRIYDTGSTDGSLKFLRSLGRFIPIELIPWSPPTPRHEWQKAAYLHAAAALSGRAEYVAFIDPDEFIVTEGRRPIADVLDAFGPTFKALASNQRVFGSGGQTHRRPGLVTERFTTRCDLDHDEGHWTKIIARPEAIESVTSAHSVALKDGAHVVMADGAPFHSIGDHPGHADRVARGPIWHHHYMLKSLEEFRQKQKRGALSDSATFTRLTDDYFSCRDEIANAVTDTTLARRCGTLRIATYIIEKHVRPWNRLCLAGPRGLLKQEARDEVAAVRVSRDYVR